MNYTSLACIIGLNINVTLMIVLNCENNILNFKSIPNDENKSKFNISLPLF
jgi:hypothetical protein